MKNFHNPEVTGSTPVLATKKLSFNNQRISIANPFFFIKIISSYYKWLKFSYQSFYLVHLIKNYNENDTFTFTFPNTYE